LAQAYSSNQLPAANPYTLSAMSPCPLGAESLQLVVRNTFLHCSEVGKGVSDAQPQLLRAHTAPLSLTALQEEQVEPRAPEEADPWSARGGLTHDLMENQDVCPEQPTLQRDVTLDPFEQPSSVGGAGGAAGPMVLVPPVTLGLVCFVDAGAVFAELEASAPVAGCVDSSASTRVPSPAGSSSRSGGELLSQGCPPSSGAKKDHRWPAQSTEAGLTTVIMRNVPNNYTQACLLELLDRQGFAGRYDFVYFPVDFRTHAALGYAFVNLVSSEAAEAFCNHFEGFCRWSHQSRKICTVAWSQPHQGLAEHLARYRNSPLMHQSVPEMYRPALFQHGLRVAFPPPTKRVKPPRQGMQRMLV